MLGLRRERRACSSPSKWSKESSSPCSDPNSPSSSKRCSKQSQSPNSEVDETVSITTADDEHERISKARERLARREVELRQIIRHCNGEMDIIRRKLCKDLGVMEVLKGEIEKAGTGPLREQLEQDFHDGIHPTYFKVDF